jgi:hypothetical protein
VLTTTGSSTRFNVELNDVGLPGGCSREMPGLEIGGQFLFYSVFSQDVFHQDPDRPPVPSPAAAQSTATAPGLHFIHLLNVLVGQRGLEVFYV